MSLPTQGVSIEGLAIIASPGDIPPQDWDQITTARAAAALAAKDSLSLNLIEE